MKFGFSLVTRGAAATPQLIEEMAQASEDAELDSVWVSDHLIFPKLKVSRYPGRADGQFPDDWRDTYWQPFSVMAYLAARTRRVRLGTSVLILPMRSTIAVAAQIAEIDQLSGGRINFGVGAGWFAEEFATLGWPFHERGARTNEGLEICKALWTTQPVNYAGRFYTIEEGGFGPKPVQRPHPPIYVGGESPAALRRLAKYGEVWHPLNPTPDKLHDLKPAVALHLEAEGRKVDELPIAPKVTLNIQDDPATEGQPCTVGRPQDVIDALKRYQDAGASEMVFNLLHETADGAMTCLRRFVDEVRPKF